MGHSFLRPQVRYPQAVREAVDGVCPSCGEARLASYRVLSEGGWWDVVKCRNCLTSLSRTPGPLFGSYRPLTRPL